MKKTLWTRNFTIITIGTIISCIGGVAMNLALGLVVFDNTSSALLTGLYQAAIMIPSVLLPILIAPYMDVRKRKPFIYGLDALLGCLYLAFAIYLMKHDFSYLLYMLFGFVTNGISSVYSTAYSAFYPDLIPEGFMQKGYSVSSLIYPTVTVVTAPISTMIYVNLGIPVLFLLVGALLLTAAAFESQIKIMEKQATAQSFSLSEYKYQIIEGFNYMKKEKGLRNIYSYMAITNACSNGTELMTMTYFQTTSALTTTMYALLTSAVTFGRMIGGLVHYVIKIPQKKRYPLTVFVYRIYQIIDSIFLFLPYPIMLLLRSFCGFLGVNSATLRETAVQSYLPPEMRARVNSLLNVAVSAMVLVVQLLVGMLGEIFPYRMVIIVCSMFSFLCIQLLVVRNRKDIEPLYANS